MPPNLLPIIRALINAGAELRHNPRAHVTAWDDWDGAVLNAEAAIAMVEDPAPDARAVPWRMRVRLYRDGVTDALADSDPELPLDAPGTTIAAGLPRVAKELEALAVTFHGHAYSIYGLDHETLRHRLKALRPTLSRRGGNAVWRVPYQTINPVSLDRADWVARVDVQKEERV